MSPVIDAHQHFWTYGTYQTSWMEAPPYAGDPAFQPLRRSPRQAADCQRRIRALELAARRCRGGLSVGLAPI
jgi:predicted TIM-barrel fold metal-dependent hydrolase